MVKSIILLGSLAHYNHPDMMDFSKSPNQLTDPIDSGFVAEFQQGTIQKPISPI